jgi:hypothetical protein
MRGVSGPALPRSALRQINDEIHGFRGRCDRSCAPNQLAATLGLQNLDDTTFECVRLRALGEDSETTGFDDQTARLLLDIRQT